MMWLRRNLPMLIAALIFCGMVGWSMLLLKQAKAAQSDVETRHQDLENSLNRLINAPIFPSEKNAESLKLQAQQLEAYCEDIHKRLPREQKQYEVMDKWKCKGYIETRVNEIRKDCIKQEVQVGSGMTCGFGRYLSSTPPKTEDTPMLLHQLDLAEKIIRILVNSRVREITSFKRTYLEGEGLPNDDKVEGAVWNRDPNLLYESQTFEINFKSEDEGLRTVLNSIASSTNFVLLARSINVTSQPANPREPQAAPAARSTADAERAGLMQPMGSAPPRRGGSPLPGGGIPPPGGQPPSNAPSQSQVVMGNEIVSTYLRMDLIELKPAEEKKPGNKGEKATPIKKL